MPKTTLLSLFKASLVLILTTLLSSVSFAARSSGGSKIGPSVGAMVLFGTGKMGNSTDVLERSMIYTPVAIFAGFNFSKFRLGLNYEYNLVGQSDDPASYNNQNIGGKGSSVGVRFDYYDGKQSFGVVYRALDKYTLDKPTVASTVSDYDGKTGFSVQYYRQLKNKIGFVIDYTSSEMKSNAANSDDIKWNRVSLGLVLTNFSAKSGRR
jgi:hypothetical protein